MPDRTDRNGSQGAGGAVEALTTMPCTAQSQALPMYDDDKDFLKWMEIMDEDCLSESGRKWFSPLKTVAYQTLSNPDTELYRDLLARLQRMDDEELLTVGRKFLSMLKFDVA